MPPNPTIVPAGPFIDPDRVSFPHYSPMRLDARLMEFLRRPEHGYPNKRIRAELDRYNDLRSRAHSLDYQIFELDQRKSVLHVEQERVGVIARPADNGGSEVGHVSLFKRPAGQLVEKTGVNEAERRRVEAELETVTADLQRLRQQRATLQAQAHPINERLKTVRRLVNAHMSSGRALKCVPLPKIDKAPSSGALRGTIEQLRADLREIDAAPLTPAIAKLRVQQWVEGLARAPYAHNALDVEGIIDLPQVAVGVDQYHPDAVGLIAWLCKDQLIAKLGDMIDAAAGSDGLDDATRTARRRDTTTKLVAAERLVEAICWSRLEAGQPVELSASASGAAILSLSEAE
jgi:hypothetical protein